MVIKTAYSTPNRNTIDELENYCKYNNYFGHLGGFFVTTKDLAINNLLFTVNINKTIRKVFGVACKNTGEISFVIRLDTNKQVIVDAQPSKSTQSNLPSYFMFYLPIMFS